MLALESMLTVDGAYAARALTALLTLPATPGSTSPYNNTTFELVVRTILVALLVLSIPLIGMWWKKTGCPPLETLAQQQVCDSTYAKDWKRQLELKVRGEKDQREAGDHNDSISALDDQYNSLNDDANQLIADINQWNSQWPPGGGNPPGGVNLSVFGELTARLNDLMGEIGDYNVDAGLANKEADDETKEENSFQADIAAFLAQLDADDKAVEKLRCVKCTKVGELIPSTRAIPTSWGIDRAVLLNPNFPAINIPPQPPLVPPGGGGGGGGQNQQQKCSCKLTHKEKEDPPAVIVSMVTIGAEFADLFAREDNNSNYKGWTFGREFHSEFAPYEGVLLRAHAMKWKTVDVNLAEASGQGAPGSFDLQLTIPLADMQCQWSIDGVKNTDASDAGKNVKLDLQLQGSGSTKGKKVDGTAAFVLMEFDKQYVDWFVESPVPHFEGKLVDFEATLTCTITPTGGAATSTKVKLSAKGTKVEYDITGVKYTRDAYDFTLSVEPASPWAASQKLVDTFPPAWRFNGAKQNVVNDAVLFRGTDESDCTLNAKWSAVNIDVKASETSLKIKEGETRILDVKVTSSATLEVSTTGQCANDSFKISDIPIDYWLDSTWTGPGSANAPNQGAPFDTLVANGQNIIVHGPTVDTETTFDVAIKANFDDFNGVSTEKTVHISVTVSPYRDMRDWYSDAHLLDKLAQLGAVGADDKEKMQMYMTSDPSLWHYADMGLKVYGLYVKSQRGTSNVSDRFKAITKDNIYTYELAAKFPNADFTLFGKQVQAGTPDFAPVPKEEFAKLHPLKRVVEPLVGTARLGDLLTESTGSDYFYRGGSLATFETAWQNYFKNVYKTSPQADWTVPDETAVTDMVKNVRFGRLRQAMAVRVNEIIRMSVASERGLEYSPKVPIQGTPRVVLSQWTNKAGVTKPELSFIFTEQTKLGQPQRFKISMEVETTVVDGVTKVKQTGKFINFLMELSDEQRVHNNTKLAQWQVPEATGASGYGSGPAKPPQSAPGAAQTVDELFDLKQTDLAMQSWKNWALDTGFKRATGSAVNAALVYTLTHAYSDLLVKYRKEGLVSAVATFGTGMLLASGKSFLTQGMLDFSTRMASYTAEALRVAEERYIAAFGRQVAKQYAKGAAREAEVVLAEKLIQAGAIPFAAARWTLTRAVPVIGWALLLYDIAVMTDSVSKSLGDLLFGPDRTPEQEAWANPLYVTRQDQVGDYYVLSRGIQIRTTSVVDDDLTQMSKQRGVSNIINMPEGATIYKTLFDSRATKFVFKDGTELEVADEVIGPNTEWLPQYMRDRLPALLPARYSGQSADPRNTQAYDIAKEKWWFYLDLEKTGHVVNKSDAATLDKLSADFANGAWSSLDPVDAAYSFAAWGSWRDGNATKWIRLKSGDRNKPYFLTWWRDYNGKECKVFEHDGQVIIEPKIDFNDLLADVTLPPAPK